MQHIGVSLVCESIGTVLIVKAFDTQPQNTNCWQQARLTNMIDKYSGDGGVSQGLPPANNRNQGQQSIKEMLSL